MNLNDSKVFFWKRLISSLTIFYYLLINSTLFFILFFASLSERSDSGMTLIGSSSLSYIWWGSLDEGVSYAIRFLSFIRNNFSISSAFAS